MQPNRHQIELFARIKWAYAQLLKGRQDGFPYEGLVKELQSYDEIFGLFEFTDWMASRNAEERLRERIEKGPTAYAYDPGMISWLLTALKFAVRGKLARVGVRYYGGWGYEIVGEDEWHSTPVELANHVGCLVPLPELERVIKLNQKKQAVKQPQYYVDLIGTLKNSIQCQLETIKQNAEDLLDYTERAEAALQLEDYREAERILWKIQDLEDFRLDSDFSLFCSLIHCLPGFDLEQISESSLRKMQEVLVKQQ